MIDAWEYEMCPERKCSLWLFTDPTWQYFMNIASLGLHKNDGNYLVSANIRHHLHS